MRGAVEAGLSEDETAETVLMEDYRHWDRYDDWRELNVRGMHRKLSAAGVGEGGEEGEGEHGDGREGRGEHAGEHGGEHGHDEGGEGEESGEYVGRDETWDATRRGARLVLSFDPETNTFAGTVENTTGETLCAVRVEVHLSTGTELGPTPRTDLAPGASTAVELETAGEAFERWTAHPEVSRCST